MTQRCLQFLSLLLCICLVAEPALHAQDSPAYDAHKHLQSIGRGHGVIVTFKDSTVEEGKLVQLSVNDFVLAQGSKGTNTFLLANVIDVSKAKSNARHQFLVVTVIVAVVAVAATLTIILTRRSVKLQQPTLPQS